MLELPCVDAGHGWLIISLPPAEVAAHPAEGAGRHELYLMCDDIHATVAELGAKGAQPSRPIAQERWGLPSAIPDSPRVRSVRPSFYATEHMFQSSKQRLRAWMDVVDEMLVGDPPDEAHAEPPHWATHPHRRPPRWQRVRRAGSVPAAPAQCLCPVRPAPSVARERSMLDNGHALTN